MVLKEKYPAKKVHLKALEIVLGLSLTNRGKGWKFILDCTRKGIKRTIRIGSLNSNSDIKYEYDTEIEVVVYSLLDVINNNINILKSTCEDHLLKLILTCKEFNVPFNFNLNFMDNYFDFKSNNFDQVDQDEFYFINCEKTQVTIKQKCQRLTLLLNPFLIHQIDNYSFVFKLFSASDSELIKFMKILLNSDEKEFYLFYTQIIKLELLSVDFFIEQLLTDPIGILTLLLDMFSETKARKFGNDYRNFHLLLLLKLEMSINEFPFNCKILLKKLSLYLEKL